jgi:hypothetical protein
MDAHEKKGPSKCRVVSRSRAAPIILAVTANKHHKTPPTNVQKSTKKENLQANGRKKGRTVPKDEKVLFQKDEQSGHP